MDDKIILGWNALMNTAISKAFAATGNDEYRQITIENMNFLLDNFTLNKGINFYHTWKSNQPKYPAFLDDYAFLIEALIFLQETTGDWNWLIKAKELAEVVIENFSEGKTGYFFYTPQGNTDVIVRKKEVYDGATPSGNAVMASNLYKLGIYFDSNKLKERSLRICASLGDAVTRYPTSFGFWANQLLEFIIGTTELAIVGPDFGKSLKEILVEYIPHKVIMCSSGGEVDQFPLLAGKRGGVPPMIYLCRNYTCGQPVQAASSIVDLLLKG